MIKQDKSTQKEGANNTEVLPLQHVAIIMDGNRRWADKKKLPRLFGHREGVQTLKRLVKHVSKRKLSFLTVYAFSSENWQRGQEEVDYLLDLFGQVLKDELEELSSAGVRLRFIGNLEGMPAKLQTDFRQAMEKTKNNKGLNLQIALNYGSRLEISQAVQKIAVEVAEKRLGIEDITPDLVSSFLYTKEVPDPDLLVRTGGEMRLSNYLLWQAAYTELYVTEIMWPDFNDKEFDKAIEEFASRQRRYGGD